ncbi:hypothetical protein [Halonatronum saccharophilum]|uniref:hypothetical protein n=1 Tax=Halonatronum saccharophilum TaxID=150060 RepID=UPI000487D159|nr:hypothetical protein [Halonatronum saccharophilum]
MKGIKIKGVLIILVLTLAILFGGNRLIDRYKVNNSLQNNLIAIEGLEDVNMDKSNGRYDFELSLGSKGDLEVIFLESKEKIEETLKGESYRIKFKDSESDTLKEVYSGINLALYEAIETGEFVKLGDRIEENKAIYNLDRGEVRVDKDYIYLVLGYEEENLYRVIERGSNRRGGGIDG